MNNKTNLYCPINPSNKCNSDCSWHIRDMCSIKLIADRLFHIAIDTNDSCQILEDMAVGVFSANDKAEED